VRMKERRKRLKERSQRKRWECKRENDVREQHEQVRRVEGFSRSFTLGVSSNIDPLSF
jgi:hypothetical protein